MLQGVLRLVAAAVLGIAALGSTAITGYLALLEKGMDQNLQAVQREVAAEKAIQAENSVLDHMVSLTDTMGGRVTAMADTADTLLVNVRAMGEANRAVLALNGKLAGDNAEAAKEMQRVSRALDDMNRSARAVGLSLDGLTATADRQETSLADILWYVTGMNARTPELP